ncbi:MAG: hypothetical protein O2923_07100 [Verrucomicrobia bacterium]|nr:hypothetical protein [Verrucomicrobiota bacterium]MDA1086203.1 hypothetical protein [Verrucomicrobiota bacterium]
MNRQHHKGKRGIALILMLGILALMAMLALTFSGTMRMERAASGNFREAAQAREILYASLTRALEALDSEIGTNGYPDWIDDVYVSGGGGSISLLSGEATNFVPGALWGAATSNSPGWIDIDEGRGAFMILNCSGLLDANYVGGSTNRTYGTNLNEIVLAGLSEMQDESGFFDDRTNGHYRYETLRELSNLQSANLSDWPQSLFHYSRALLGYLDQAGSPQTNVVNISGSASNLVADRTRIVAAFTGAGLNGAEAAFAFENLIDYVDADSVPRDIGSGTTEAVPMINEVQVIPIILPTQAFPASVLPPGYGVGVEEASTLLLVRVEFFYPFVKASPDNFTLHYRIEVDPGGSTPAEIAEATTFIAAGGEGTADVGYNSEVKRYYTVDIITTNFSTSTVVRSTSESIVYDVDIWLAVSNATDLVDAMPFPVTAAPMEIETTALNIPTSITEFVSSVPIVSTNGTEAGDPRFNWDPALAAVQWFPYSLWGPGYQGSIFDGPASLPVANKITQEILTNSITDGHTDMYVANEPLRQPGELSYLLRGANISDRAWRTIRLFELFGSGSNYLPPDRILDRFTTVSNTVVFRGRVNPNTRQRDVLASLFYEMPLDEYPGLGDNRILLFSDAQRLADSFLSARGSDRFQNLSELGTLSDIFTDPALMTATPFEREAFLRNSSELLSVRQNLFTILLSGESVVRAQDSQVWVEREAAARYGVAPGWFTTVEADQRAVAIVWRDPYPDPNRGNRHGYLVQELKLLSR